MKRNIIKKILILLILCVACIRLQHTSDASASSADIVFSSEKNSFELGEEFDVDMVITADVFPGSFEGFIKYNADVLEYIGDSPVISGGEGILKLTDNVFSSDRNTRKYTLRFKAVDKGYSEIGLRGAPELYEFEEGYQMSVSSTAFTLSVGNAEDASSDSSLSSLKISPGKLTPSFSPDTTEYRTAVQNDVTRLVVSAAASDNGADVSVTSTELEVGQNRIVITVTAEDDSQTKYVIYCIRDKAPEEKEDSDTRGEAADGNLPVQDSTDENSDKTITNETQTGDNITDSGAAVASTEDASEHWKFYSLQGGDRLWLIADTGYEVVSEVPGNISIPEDYVKTSILVNGNRVTVYAPGTEPDSDFLLLILKKEGQEPGLYRYDRAEKTIQRYTEKEKVPRVTAIDNVEELKESYSSSLETLTIIIAVLCGVCMILLIIVIRLALKKKDEEEL